MGELDLEYAVIEIGAGGAGGLPAGPYLQKAGAKVLLADGNNATAIHARNHEYDDDAKCVPCAVGFAAGVVFLAFVPRCQKGVAVRRIRIGIAVTLAIVFDLPVSLLRAGADLASAAVVEAAVLEEVDAWVGDRNVDVAEPGTDPPADAAEVTEISVDVVGNDESGSLRTLADRIAVRLGRPAEIVVRSSLRPYVSAISSELEGS